MHAGRDGNKQATPPHKSRSDRRTSGETPQKSFPGSTATGSSTLYIRQHSTIGPRPLSPFALGLRGAAFFLPGPPAPPASLLPFFLPLPPPSTPRSEARAVPCPHRSRSRSMSSRDGGGVEVAAFPGGPGGRRRGRGGGGDDDA